jgi:hypothetical protein
VNDCSLCLTLRPEDGPDSRFYDAILGDGENDGDADGLTAREALAAEFALRFATDHLGMDDAFWARLHAVYSDDELVQLGLCTGSWLAFGRLNQVFGVDQACQLTHSLPFPDSGRGEKGRVA